MTKEKHKEKKPPSRYPFFDWRRFKAFSAQMALAYFRNSLTLALGGGFLIASTILITSPLRVGLTPDFLSLINFSLKIVASSAVLSLSILMLGLALNALTVGVFMGFHQDHITDTEALILIPRYLFAYNLIMMPLLLILYLTAVTLPPMLAILLGINSVAVSFVAGDVARHAWNVVAKWYLGENDKPHEDYDSPKHILTTSDLDADDLSFDMIQRKYKSEKRD